MRREHTNQDRLVDLSALEPRQQACLLSEIARDARLLEFALDDADGRADGIAGGVERALELAMDAEGESEAALAHEALTLALATMKDHGLAISAGVASMEVDGLLGPMRMPVLTAVLAPVGAAHCA